MQQMNHMQLNFLDLLLQNDYTFSLSCCKIHDYNNNETKMNLI